MSTIRQNPSTKTRQRVLASIAVGGLVSLILAAIHFVVGPNGENKTTSAPPAFVESASSWGLNLSGPKTGGHAWSDFDLDGDLDVLINTSSSTYKSRLYQNNGDGTFSDVTFSLAPTLLVNVRQRSAVWGDLNNDGYPDFLRNYGASGSQRIEVYLQNPTTHVFGNGAEGTTPVYIGSSSTDNVIITNGMNSEACGMFDFDGDGDLDIYFDNHDFGVDILRNNYIDHTTGSIVAPVATAMFSFATPGTTVTLGLNQSATDGDYGTCADVNDDGWVDLFMRKRDENDFFLNIGGTFTNGQNLGQASNGNKGGNRLFDLDNDGDFDAIWTDNGGNKIFRNDGEGIWVELSSVFPGIVSSGIDDAACGDIDNDGDIDILMVGESRSYLYMNQINDPILGPNTGTAMTFVLDSQTFNTGDGEGTTMVDIDGDGDLDIYMNIDDGENQLWINQLYDGTTSASNKNYLNIDVFENRAPLGFSGSEHRYALGATVKLLDCDGNPISGIREVNGGTGHGVQEVGRIHFGLPFGPDYPYKIYVKYTNLNIGDSTSRARVYRMVYPADSLGGSLLSVFYPNSESTDCRDKDLDGIADPYDIDRDNDGIPNIEEGCMDTDISGTIGIGNNLISGTTYNLSGVEVTYSLSGDFGQVSGYDAGENGNSLYVSNGNGTGTLTMDFSNPVSQVFFKLTDFDYDEIFTVNVYDENNNLYDLTGKGILLVGSNVGQSGNSFLPFQEGEIDGNLASMDTYGSVLFYFPDKVSQIAISYTMTTHSIRITQPMFCITDSDNDNVLDNMDLDADNDGVPDIVEAGGADIDGEGRVDNSTDTDGDGLVDTYDNDDTDGIKGASPCSPQPACLIGSTSSLLDSNGDGTPDTPADFDQDNLPNWQDLDSDDDGILDIVEVGGTDANKDGQVDFVVPGDPSSMVDADGDGFADAVDGDTDNDGVPENTSNALLATSADGNNDGKPDSGYPQGDADSDQHLNFLDIDADDDGIVDNSEAQATITFISPANSDSDGDGIDNAYDNFAGFGGNGLTPQNTDGGDSQDFLDLDSDNDGETDRIEGHDANGDGLVGAVDLCVANTGLYTDADTDGDGLDNGFDNNNTSSDPTNGNLTPSSHPRIDQGPDQDWRSVGVFAVEWLSFTAKLVSGDGILYWSTANEVNAEYFDVERSTDGIQYLRLGEVSATGNSTSQTNYTFEDPDVANLGETVVYYRLRQVDLDGKFEHSPVVELKIEDSESLSLRAYPNPVKDRLNLNLEIPRKSQALLRIMNSKGQEVFRKEYSNIERVEEAINASNWSRGVYFLNFSAENEETTMKVVKE